ncbi:MAG: hypothetical protein EPN55_01275 [Gammaproteobacteria bacterium]|nr:MAG: hypothetical protein EPN55_01275 [Gammaproteobacteria bacterium]
MLNIGQVVSTVQKNCHIADAQSAGDLTLCIYLLKMREFYRWENDIPLTRQLAKEDVGQWLQEREQMWQHLESNGFEPIPLERGPSDPFDADAVNRELVPQGYVYSGGYGRFCKPQFFLGNLVTKETRNGFTVYISSCEYARDLEAPPAMLQGRTIFVRQESVRRYLWEKVEESRWNKNNEAMHRALACYPFELDAEQALDRMMHNETESIVLHELGEGTAGEMLGPDWERMLGGLSRSKAEIMARAVRDNYADCLATLPALVETRNDASLHFYFATFGGMRRHLFPEALAAYRRWCADGDLDPLRQLARTGQARWRETAERMLALYRQDENRAPAEIARLLDTDNSL